MLTVKKMDQLFSNELKLYDNLKERHVASFEKLKANGFPVMMVHNSGPEQAQIDSKLADKLIADDVHKLRCCRCDAIFDVDEYDQSATEYRCRYHPGKRVTGELEGGAAGEKWRCCGGPRDSDGCTTSFYHAYLQTRRRELLNFIRTPKEDSEYDPRSRKVYILEAAFVYTTGGPEIARLLAVSWDGQPVLDLLVDANREYDIFDYDSFNSGITYEDVKDIKVDMYTARDVLFKLINHKTILVGHCLDMIMRAMKMVHLNIVDTSLIYRSTKLNCKYSLRSSTAHHLNFAIHEKGYDLDENCQAILQLLCLRVKEEFRRRHDNTFRFIIRK
ncbi:unnamed protein product [Bursaphelenchus xylophilus]|uniref:(pine wood nematode) hypothetical protein n=1 Tax=Bursaphelenchus xylophilus TaxID=6326 RepID=A0A1I7RLL8_BURXY|nr:unnamed protein product [Bursaphelenchus xylophilus]CAG9082850.1 unnamed protein product [Bursaphelenchus xylophilus]